MGDGFADACRHVQVCAAKGTSDSVCRDGHTDLADADQEQIQGGEDSEENGQKRKGDRVRENFAAKNLIGVFRREEEHIALVGVEFPVQDIDAEHCHDENAEGGGEGENQRARAGQRDGSCYGPGHEQGFSDDGDEENGQGDVFGFFEFVLRTSIICS